MDKDIKPCPFCGEMPISVEWNRIGNVPGTWRIRCRKWIDCLAPYCVEPSRELAIKKWNTRKGEGGK
jgi:hypothetical protein